jgi:hypothetical protein
MGFQSREVSPLHHPTSSFRLALLLTLPTCSGSEAILTAAAASYKLWGRRAPSLLCRTSGRQITSGGRADQKQCRCGSSFETRNALIRMTIVQTISYRLANTHSLLCCKTWQSPHSPCSGALPSAPQLSTQTAKRTHDRGQSRAAISCVRGQSKRGACASLTPPPLSSDTTLLAAPARI